MRMIEEATQKLIANCPHYVEDAVWDSATRFESMSDNGTDSMYADPARRWRSIGHRLEANEIDKFDTEDLTLIAAGILWYELNKST